MKEIRIELYGIMTIEVLYNKLNEGLKFTYAQPNWDSLVEALGALDWLPKGTIVKITVYRDAVFSPSDLMDILTEASARNEKISNVSSRILKLTVE